MIEQHSILLPEGTTDEAAEVIHEFVTMLLQVTGDGARKRAAGLKPHWTIDSSHRAAIFSHLKRDAQGEKVDPDSGASPWAHIGWRALALAWQETQPLRADAPAISAEQDAVAHALDAIAKVGPKAPSYGGM